MVTTTTNLGRLSTTVVQTSDFLNTTFDQDVRAFSIRGTRNINLHLFGMSADGDDADLSLYRDTNRNGVLDSADQLLRPISNRGGNLEDSLNYQAGAGNYLAVVDRFRLGSDQFLPYRLNLSATDALGGVNGERASNLLPNEFSVGRLSSDRFFSDSVGSTDTTDTFSFSLGRRSGVNISLTGLTSDADMRLIQDLNNNRIVESNEVIDISNSGSTTSEFISFAGRGDFYLQVYQFSGNTNYNIAADYFTT